jgi:subtilisin-like proprotein convertase family protein
LTWLIALTAAGMTLLLLAAFRAPHAARAASADPFNLSWTSIESDATTSVAWGDYDGDGDLDLAVGNGQHYDDNCSCYVNEPNRLYRNDNGVLTLAAVWSSAESDNTTSIAWGDVDGDGDLDLAVGNSGSPNLIYRNDTPAKVLTPTFTLAWTAPLTDTTTSFAWGDVDGDGHLDLVVGNNGQPNRLYRNASPPGAVTPTLTLAWTAALTDSTSSLAWGDVDGDGDLDLAVGNIFQPSRVYRNDGGALTASPIYSTTRTDNTRSVAWGDVDGDGDPDLLLGNFQQADRLYRNDGGILTANSVWASAESSATRSVAWGDYDGDGDLDLIVGNSLNQPNRLYRNDGGQLTTSGVWASPEGDQTLSVAWGDYDNDGDLDLVVGNSGTSGQPNRLYRNDGGTLTASAVYASNSTDHTSTVAWGDVDGDGDLDLAVGNSGEFNQIYRNDSGPGVITPTFTLAWTAPQTNTTTSLAWGDVDGDGDLDLAVGNSGEANQLYLNETAPGAVTPTLTLAWSSTETDPTNSLAWGDYDGDGDLDLVVGNGCSAAPTCRSFRLYRNDGGALTTSAAWSSTESNLAHSVAWGDADNDGDLDLAVGYSYQPIRLYRNDNGALQATAVWTSTETANTHSLAWGDVDGDGDLDLLAGNFGGPKRLYRNDGGTLTSSAAWSSVELDYTESVAWGDYDGDGDLDLAVGNTGFASGQPSRLYRNDSGTLTERAVWSFNEIADTTSVAWGDMDRDGDLDLAMASVIGVPPNWWVYLNTRDANRNLAASPMLSLVRPQPPADANFYSSAKVWPGVAIPFTYTLLQHNGLPVREIVGEYSLNGGGHWLPAVATTGTAATNLDTSTLSTFAALTNTSLLIPVTGVVTSTLQLTPTSAIADLDVHLNLTHTADGNLLITLTAPSGLAVLLSNRRGGTDDNFTNTIFDDEAATSIMTGIAPFTGRFRPEQTLAHFDGQLLAGTWSLVFNDLTDLDDGELLSWGITATLRNGAVYTYSWDPLASGVLGQSDNVAFRLTAIPAVVTGTRNATPGPYLFGSSSAQTFPFRVRGMQVRVISGTQPISNAVVYRLPMTQTVDGQLIADSAGQPFRTDSQGYLQGRGQLTAGDQLFALVPITWTDTYTLYYTSGTPNSVGVTITTVSATGVQTLTVSANNPLYLFNIEVALEWDASRDPNYLDQLRFNLQRTTNYLYDFTNGQATLGEVIVAQNADDWVYANVLVRANNRLRPFSAQGGIVLTPTVDPQHSDIVYAPGQLAMGSTWNRYGTPGVSIGDDWALILAHELSHYLFFHDDTYLGLDANGYLIPVSTCKGSAMGDLYGDPDATEFIADEAYWLANCGQTLPQVTLGRDEWQTMQLWYPALITPTVANPGPSLMPFNFTTVQISAPLTPTNALDDPTFYLNYAGGGVSSSESRAYLIRDDKYVIDLGAPFGGQNRVLARGAQPGDRLCVFDRPQAQFGCETIAQGDDQIQMKRDTAWTPIVQISPVNSTTLDIAIDSLPSGLSVQARMFPEFGSGGSVITLTETGGIYSGTFTLADVAMAGHVQVWVQEGELATETDPRREAIVAFSIGGNPGALRAGGGALRAGGGALRAGGGALRAGGGALRAGGGALRAGGAPIVSPDGQMIFFTANPLVFAEGQFYTIQGMAGLPALPPGRTVIGQGYNLVATPGTPVITGSVSIQYLSNDVLVAGANEEQLTIYFWDGSKWNELETTRNTYFNLASAPSQGAGIYALMSSLQVPLKAAGWNLFAYPSAVSRPVTEALLSISGYYTTVYGYYPEDAADPWKLYDVTVPEPDIWGVNDLSAFEYGRGYWINASQAITLHLQGPTNASGGIPYPPATFYGSVQASPGFSPTAGMTLTAWIDDVQCGQGQTRNASDQIVYALDVLAADAGAAAGCGVPGRTVRFKMGGREMVTTAVWDTRQVWQLPLTNERRVYLPTIAR